MNSLSPYYLTEAEPSKSLLLYQFVKKRNTPAETKTSKGLSSKMARSKATSADISSNI
jgi:hypothetical protein